MADQALKLQLLSIRAATEAALALLADSDAPVPVCAHRTRQEMTALGDPVRTLFCPECGVTWEEGVTDGTQG